MSDRPADLMAATETAGATEPTGGDERTRVLARNLAAVEERVAAACRAVGRARAEVTVLGVTKTWPADDVHRLRLLGVREVAENRDQEAARKAAEVETLAGEGATVLRWHFIGALQTNKARSVVGYAAVVHTVDRVKLVGALDRAAREQGRHLDCLLQVRVQEDPRPGGVAPEELAALAAAVAEAGNLRVRGLMAVAPLGEDPVPAFARVAAAHEQVRLSHPEARWLSLGMSGDLEAAVAHGATHLRIGTALLGSRPPLG